MYPKMAAGGRAYIIQVASISIYIYTIFRDTRRDV